MDGNMFVVNNESDPVEEARAAGTAIARARHEVRRRVGEFLDNAVDDEELIQRMSYPDVDEIIDEATERHLGSVTDGKAKLARSLVREVHARKEAAEDKTARDQITCPNCRGQGCTECEQTGQIDDDKRPGGTSDR